MGRILLFLLVLATVIALWAAYVQPAINNYRAKKAARPELKGPDDDPEFLWRLEKERYQKNKAEQEEGKENKDHHNPDSPPAPGS